MTTKVKNLAEFIREKNELEKILDSKVITTEDLANLLKFATQPNESVIKYRASAALPEVSRIINVGIDSLFDTLDSLKTERINRQAIKDSESQCKKFKRILDQTDKVLTGDFLLHLLMLFS